MSTREGSFETEEQFVASHRKFIHEDIWVALRVLLLIALSVTVVFLAARIKQYFEHRKR